MEPCLLLLLAWAPSYGYKLIENLKKGQFIGTNPDAGAVYRILRKLERDGCVQSVWSAKEPGPARRIYTITKKGEKLLTKWAESITAKRESLDKFLAEYNKRKTK